MAEQMQAPLKIDGSRPGLNGKADEPVPTYSERGVPADKTLSSAELNGAEVTAYDSRRKLVEVTKGGQSYLVRIERLDFNGINEDKIDYRELETALASRYPTPAARRESAAGVAVQPVNLVQPAPAQATPESHAAIPAEPAQQDTAAVNPAPATTPTATEPTADERAVIDSIHPPEFEVEGESPAAKPAPKPAAYSAEQQALRGTVQGQLKLSAKPSAKGPLIVDNAAESPEKNKVMIIQRALKAAGADLGAYGTAKDGVDGKIGPKTTAALEAFAKEHGLSVEELAKVLDKVVQSQGTEHPLSLEEATKQFQAEKQNAQAPAPSTGLLFTVSDVQDQKIIEKGLKKTVDPHVTFYEQRRTQKDINGNEMDIDGDNVIDARDMDRNHDGKVDKDDVAILRATAEKAGIPKEVLDKITFNGEKQHDAEALGRLAAAAVGVRPQPAEGRSV